MQKTTFYSLFFVGCFAAYSSNMAVSMVYNFRMSEITRNPPAETPGGKHHNVIALPFVQLRKKYYSDIHQNFEGILGSYIQNFGSYYLRVDGGFAHIKETTYGLPTFCGVEADDMLFTVGKNLTLGKKTNLSVSGLLGIPTHNLYRLQHVDFGYSLVGTGAQVDGIYR